MLTLFFRRIMPTLALSIVPFYVPTGGAQCTDHAYDPTATKVAILPVVNSTGEKNEKASNAQCKLVANELLHQFRDRGFRVLEAEVVTAAMKKLDADMSDEEQRKRARMLEVGKEAGADLTVFVLITDQADSDSDPRIPKVATIKAWLLDVPQQKAILSARVQEGRSHFSNAFNSGSIKRALLMAVDDAFKDFFKPYRKGKRAATEGTKAE